MYYSLWIEFCFEWKLFVLFVSRKKLVEILRQNLDPPILIFVNQKKVWSGHRHVKQLHIRPHRTISDHITRTIQLAVVYRQCSDWLSYYCVIIYKVLSPGGEKRRLWKQNGWMPFCWWSKLVQSVFWPTGWILLKQHCSCRPSGPIVKTRPHQITASHHTTACHPPPPPTHTHTHTHHTTSHHHHTTSLYTTPEHRCQVTSHHTTPSHHTTSHHTTGTYTIDVGHFCCCPVSPLHQQRLQGCEQPKTQLRVVVCSLLGGGRPCKVFGENGRK